MITGEDYDVIAGKMCRVHRTLASLGELSTFAGLTLSFVKTHGSAPRCENIDSEVPLSVTQSLRVLFCCEHSQRRWV